MDDVTRNRQQIGLGTANLFEALDAQQAQEHFLRKICGIGGIAQTGRQKAPQTLPVFRSNVGDKGLVGLVKQVSSVAGLGRALERQMQEIGHCLFIHIGGGSEVHRIR